MTNKIQHVMSCEGPVICEVVVDPDQQQMPKVEARHTLDDMYPYEVK